MKKLNPVEFTKLAIVKLRDPGYPGIHTVIKGFNDAYRKYFEGADPVEDTKKMIADGVIDGRVCKGGAMIYLKGEMPKGNKYAKGDDALNKMFNDKAPTKTDVVKAIKEIKVANKTLTANVGFIDQLLK